MKLVTTLTVFLAACAGNVWSFVTPVLTTTTTSQRSQHSTTSSSLWSSASEEERFKAILEDESMNPANLKATAEQMKSMKPSDIDAMMAEMDRMPAAQMEQLKRMGMDPEIMKSTMEMMKSNPEMMKSMGQMMENMTPEQLVEQSRQAQQKMKSWKDEVASSSSSSSTAPPVTDAQIVNAELDSDEDDEEEEDEEPIEPDQNVLDAMFRVAEIMSPAHASGGVTYQAFITIPPVAVLSGNGEDDLSTKELKDCWNKGSLGATRVDRAGFERVWRQVQDNYYSDIVEEAQDRMLSKKKNRGSAASANPTSPPATVPSTAQPARPMVGASISPEQLQQEVKNMKDEDMVAMFDRMDNITPEEEARMRAMGVDPAMMKKSAAVMKNNPLLRKAATAMLKNTSPEQLQKASQQAQERMANMSEEEKKKMFDSLQ